MNHCFNLVPYNFRIDCLHGADPLRVLGGDAGNGGGTVDFQRGKCLEISLYARAPTTVGARDGKRDGAFRTDRRNRDIAIRADRHPPYLSWVGERGNFG